MMTVPCTPFEQRRGRQMLEQQLDELRACCDELNIVRDLYPVPIKQAHVSDNEGRSSLVWIDPLRLLDRAGIRP